VRQWLARHPRWTFHFTPTSASWLNAVEGFFAKLTKRRLKRGIFLSVVDLQAAINRFVIEHNAKPKPLYERELVKAFPHGAYQRSYPFV
jgi:transposase